MMRTLLLPIAMAVSPAFAVDPPAPYKADAAKTIARVRIVNEQPLGLAVTHRGTLTLCRQNIQVIAGLTGTETQDLFTPRKIQREAIGMPVTEPIAEQYSFKELVVEADSPFHMAFTGYARTGMVTKTCSFSAVFNPEKEKDYELRFVAVSSGEGCSVRGARLVTEAGKTTSVPIEISKPPVCTDR